MKGGPIVKPMKCLSENLRTKCASQSTTLSTKEGWLNTPLKRLVTNFMLPVKSKSISKKNHMKVPIDEMTFAESEYHRGNKIWNAQTLYDFAKAKEYPVMDMPLWCIDLTTEAFECSQLHSFIFQCKRVRNCSLDYPIILDEVGQIADGYHRLCKAILEGKETIKAIRLLEMPAPDRIEEE